MSSTAKLSKKQKKSLAFRSRKGKSKDNVILDVPENDLLDEDADVGEVKDGDAKKTVEEASKAVDGSKSAAEVQPKTTKERKRKRPDEAATPTAETANEMREKKRKKEAKSAEDENEDENEDKATFDDDENEAKTEVKSVKKQRFILFVGMLVEALTDFVVYSLRCQSGNLKYTTTADVILDHFSACGMFAMRFIQMIHPDIHYRSPTKRAPSHSKTLNRAQWQIKTNSEVKRMRFP